MSAAKVVVTSSGVAQVTVSRVRAPYARAGSEAVTVASETVTVAFTTPLPDNNYVIAGCIANTTDNPNITPILTFMPTSKGASGFTVRLSAPALTDNYRLYWAIAEIFSP